MPHLNSSAGGGDDLGSEDEVKVFKDEGEDEKRSSENLIEEKSSLIDLTESEEKVSHAVSSYTTGKISTKCELNPIFGKLDASSHPSSFNMGYFVASYPYTNGAGASLPASMATKMGLSGTHPSGLPFFCPNGDHLTQPPPAHMGIPPYGSIDANKAAAVAGLTRTPIYPFSTSQYPYSMLSSEMTQVAASWHTPSMYPISPTSAGFRNHYSASLPITSSSLSSDLYRFSPASLMPHHPSLSPHTHALTSHAVVSPNSKLDHSPLDQNQRSSAEQKSSALAPPDEMKNQNAHQHSNQDKKKPHIKKPLNAFMLYMKEMRAKVVAECTLKESAAINQILGRRWHALGRDEQAKYYELARRERQLHMQLYPDWSSRANTNRAKKRKRKQDTNSDSGGNNTKKCRARFGLDQQSQWCKPCSPEEDGTGVGLQASIVHHSLGNSAGGGVSGAGSTPRPRTQSEHSRGGSSTARVNTSIVSQNPISASNASTSPPRRQQEPTYVNL